MTLRITTALILTALALTACKPVSTVPPQVTNITITPTP